MSRYCSLKSNQNQGDGLGNCLAVLSALFPPLTQDHWVLFIYVLFSYNNLGRCDSGHTSASASGKSAARQRGLSVFVKAFLHLLK